MKPEERDRLERVVKEAKGRLKRKWTKAAAAPDKPIEGAADPAEGNLQKKTGQIKLDRLRE